MFVCRRYLWFPEIHIVMSWLVLYSYSLEKCDFFFINSKRMEMMEMKKNFQCMKKGDSKKNRRKAREGSSNSSCLQQCCDERESSVRFLRM